MSLGFTSPYIVIFGMMDICMDIEMTYRGDVIKDAAAYKNAQFYDLAKSHLSLLKNILYKVI